MKEANTCLPDRLCFEVFLRVGSNTQWPRGFGEMGKNQDKNQTITTAYHSYVALCAQFMQLTFSTALNRALASTSGRYGKNIHRNID